MAPVAAPPAPPFHTAGAPAGGKSASGWLASHKAVAAGAAGVVVLALYQRNKATASTAGGSGTSVQGSGAAAPMPTYGYDSSVLDAYNQLSGAISNLNDEVSTLQANQGKTTGLSSPPSVSSHPLEPAASAPAPATPANKYTVGQTVAPGETITGAVFSPVFGWLDETSKGGVYQGGGGQGKSISALPFGGSYLGYLGSIAGTPQGKAEAANPMGFAGAPTLLPNGGYVLQSTTRAKYQFGT